MALNNNFYREIFEKEEYWIKLINMNLLNAYYLSELKDFYSKKQSELLQEQGIMNNEFLKNILNMINKALYDIEVIMNENKKGNKVSIASLQNSFLINKMNNNVKEDNISEIRIETNTSSVQPVLEDEYLCDEFDEEVKPLKR